MRGRQPVRCAQGNAGPDGTAPIAAADVEDTCVPLLGQSFPDAQRSAAGGGSPFVPVSVPAPDVLAAAYVRHGKPAVFVRPRAGCVYMHAIQAVHTQARLSLPMQYQQPSRRAHR